MTSVFETSSNGQFVALPNRSSPATVSYVPFCFTRITSPWIVASNVQSQWKVTVTYPGPTCVIRWSRQVPATDDGSGHEEGATASGELVTQPAASNPRSNTIARMRVTVAP